MMAAPKQKASTVAKLASALIAAKPILLHDPPNHQCELGLKPLKSNFLLVEALLKRLAPLP
jgi:hypothetical protein